MESMFFGGGRGGYYSDDGDDEEEEQDLEEKIRNHHHHFQAGERASGGGGGQRENHHAGDPKTTTTTEQEEVNETLTNVFQGYETKSLPFETIPHPCKVVESSSLNAVALPKLTYPLVSELIENRKLSGLQLEGVAYACQKHQEYLEDGRRRAGFFIGDGAGIGKGRQIAGVIFDNYCRGRRRHVWVSTSIDLARDAMRDLTDLGCHAKIIRNFQELDNQTKATGLSRDFQEGILFTTYSTLVSATGKYDRFQQIIDWFGEGEDGNGCLVFDECHKAKNSGHTAGAGKKSSSDNGSQTAKAVREMQEMCPEARVLYCSATGVSEIGNMAYMERMGFWGPSTPFKDAETFIKKLQDRGVGFLEMLAIEMKAGGKYVARALSFEEAEFRTETVKITAQQRAMYDSACQIWQDVRVEYEDLAHKRGEKSGMFMKLYWSAHQRFFKLLCVSFKIPFVVKEVEEALERGECALIGLQTTGEAQDTRLNLQYGFESDVPTSTTQEILRQFIMEHFKTDVNGKSNGTAEEQEAVKLLPVADLPDGWKQRADGTITGPRTHEEAYKVKEALLKRVEELDLPPNFLDDLIDKLGGVEKVAEMTGRRARMVRHSIGEESGLTYEPRFAVPPVSDDGRHLLASASNNNKDKFASEMDSINIREAKWFMEGSKLVAIISDAASTGISLHASKKVPNQRRRVHITVELPWAADKAIQQLGRSHRSNQAQGPLYVMVSTDIGGERRFVSAVARRLQSLGALTRGDRRAATGVDLSDGNVDSFLGKRSLQIMFDALNAQVDNDTFDFKLPTGVSLQSVWKHAGLSDDEYQRKISEETIESGKSLRDIYVELSRAVLELGEKGGEKSLITVSAVNVRRFLNRLLGVPVLRQNILFGLFGDTLHAVINAAKLEGSYTEGVNQLGGQHVALDGKANQVVLTEPFHGARLLKSNFVSDRGLSWDQAFEMYKTSGSRYPRDGFYFKKKKWYGRREIMLVFTAPGTDELEVEIYRPNMGRVQPNHNRFDFMADNTRIEDKDPGWWIESKAKEEWDFTYDKTEFGCKHYGKCQNAQSGIHCNYGSRAERCCIVNGAVVSMWKELETVLRRHQSSVLFRDRHMRVVRVETNLKKRQEEAQTTAVAALLPDSNGSDQQEQNPEDFSLNETNNGTDEMFEIVGIRYPEKLLPLVVAAAEKNWEEKKKKGAEIKGRMSLKKDDVTPIDPFSYKKATTQQKTMKNFFKSSGNKKTTSFLNWDDFEDEENAPEKNKKTAPLLTAAASNAAAADDASKKSNVRDKSVSSSARIQDFFKRLPAEVADLENLVKKQKTSEEARERKRLLAKSPTPIPLKESIERDGRTNASIPPPPQVEYIEID